MLLGEAETALLQRDSPTEYLQATSQSGSDLNRELDSSLKVEILVDYAVINFMASIWSYKSKKMGECVRKREKDDRTRIEMLALLPSLVEPVGAAEAASVRAH